MTPQVSNWLLDFFGTKTGKFIAGFYIILSLLMSGSLLYVWFTKGVITVDQVRPVITVILPIIICLYLITLGAPQKHTVTNEKEEDDK
ncbi:MULTISPECIES: hypothetical protein [Vibrio]|uniref:hypothetical protein n=1 Tax=Vibrio TaxID=662 RepID=UPI001B8162DD|nr:MULTISPECIES: hypothetical protein [Vibrio]BDP38316.1 hypothetical protein VA208B3_46870 [Vibrio alginolyticus]MDF5646540.1 hypothetical protein [Vibrio parahaemolyticus]MDF5666202.1 hypothetical protein [Vibrio parahaemolyticus]WKV19457.1 hypothetical protein [Vibrio parahaemolyticus]BDP33440.1 hypothetical protein VV208B2_45200 [Vibrio vulnificus]